MADITASNKSFHSVNDGDEDSYDYTGLFLNNPSTMFLFTTGGPNYNKLIGKERIYYFTIKDNGTLVRDFVPVLDTFDNKYGLYDIVEGKFYGNISSDTFAGGDFIDNSAIITSTDIVSLTYDHVLIARWVPETP